MRVISRRKLREFWSKHGDAQTSLLLWYQRTDESSIMEILEKKQEMTAKQVQKLGDFFQISPIRFLASE
jgi:mRNA-degrading endonuclease HigB of HigAB toxin-antitoxin module